MPGNGLSSIPDLQERQRTVLARELEITTLDALVQADRRAIQQAMRNLRPRPSLALIAQWQDHARNRLNEGTVEQPDWRPVASFAVVFAERQTDDGWQRRIEAERTEVEPEEERRIWPDWDCGGICRWMHEQIPGGALPEAAVAHPVEPDTAQPVEAETAQPVEAETAKPVEPEAAQPVEPTRPRVGPARVTGRRRELRISKVTVIDRAQPRIEVSVSGARPDQEVHAVARVLRQDGNGWNLQDPVVITGAGVASFDLSPLPAGRHDVVLVAWAPDGTVTLARKELPDLIIPP